MNELFAPKPMDFSLYATAIRSVKVGKQLPDAVYLHESALQLLPHELRGFIAKLATELDAGEDTWNVIKLHKRDFRMTFLNYAEFFLNPFPALSASITIDLHRGTARRVDFSGSDNPPILHRKELLLDPAHGDIERLAEVTRRAESAGLFAEPRRIGFKKQWERLLNQHGFAIVDNELVQKTAPVQDVEPIGGHVVVHRHLTAIDRNNLSRPMQLMARHGYLNGDFSILDYGCGKGDDLRELEAHGVTAYGWDPVHHPEGTLTNADVVNLGFVINVIEDRRERAETLRCAYGYADRVLVVSAMVAGPATIAQFRPYKDGVITSRNTFQKYYSQAELKEFIESSIDDNATALAPGVFAVFKDKVAEQTFLSERQRVHRTWQQLSSRGPETAGLDVEKLYSEHQPLLDYFRDTVLELGRIPANDEFEYSERIRAIAGSHKKALDVVTERYGTKFFSRAAEGRESDLLVYFALGLFERRKPYKAMPEGLRRDVKVFFGGYSAALEEAKELLFSIASPARIQEEAVAVHRTLDTGILAEGHSLTIHRSLLPQLSPVLRVYVGAALQLYGDLDDMDLVKLHFRSGKVTVMRYDDFDGKAIPELLERVKINMREQDIEEFFYSDEYPPQPLYLKSRVLPSSSPHFEKQRKFDKSLLRLGVFDFSGFGPSKLEFQSTLAEHGYRIGGFRITRVSSLAGKRTG